MDPDDITFKPLTAAQVHDLKVKAAEQKRLESITVPPVRSSDEPPPGPWPTSSPEKLSDQAYTLPSLLGITANDLENSGKALGGALVGLAELAVSPAIMVFKASYNAMGALAYSATDLVYGEPDRMYQAQADAVSGAIEGTKEFFATHAPADLPGLAFGALTAGLDQASEALDRGDAFGAGRGVAHFMGGVYLFEKTLEGISSTLSSLNFEPVPSLEPAPVSVGGPQLRPPARDIPVVSKMEGETGPPSRLPSDPATPESAGPFETSGSGGTPAPKGTSPAGETGTIRPESAAPIPGDADFVGAPAPRTWTLSPRGQGAHMVERSNVRGRPELAVFDEAGTPRYYPEDVPGHAGEAHRRLHAATRDAGIKLKGGNPEMTDDQLLEGYSRAYADPGLQRIRGELRTPDGSIVLGKQLSPIEAYEALLRWFRSTGPK